MVKGSNYFRLFLFVALLLFVTSFASAWEFNGTVYNQNSVAMNNASVNVSFYQNGYQYVGSNFTYTNSSGVFNLSVLDDSTYQYKIVIRHYHDNVSDYVDYVGGILPNFPFQALQGGISTTFFLKPAGTLNITAVNATGSAGLFQYMIKDVATGYKIGANFNSFVSSARIVVPRDGNYSIEIFPDSSMPVSYEWNNWSDVSYNINDAGNSTYNGTLHQLNKVFNTSIQFYRITGHLLNTSGGAFTSLSNMSIIPFDLEAGNMIFLGTNSGMPYNLSALDHTCEFTTVADETNAYVNLTGYQLQNTGFSYNITKVWANVSGTPYLIPSSNYTLSSDGVLTNATVVPDPTGYNDANVSYTYYNACSDLFNKTDGTFNITIPGPTENANILFMASVNNSGSYLIGYRNISINFSGPSSYQVNFTMYPAMGSSIQQLSQNNASNFSASVNSSVAEQVFNVINLTGSLINQGLHIEASVDYTNFNATSFSMLVDPQSSGTFYLPLINNTGLTSVNVYSHSYAPTSLTSLTTSQIIQNNNNITLSAFDPKDIDGSSSGVRMALLKSNSTCNAPNPGEGCFIGSNDQNINGNPLSAIIGGGKVNFIMGLLNTGVIVKYINVNMIASGPPSALFDSSATTSTSNGFSSAMRFGSLGPKIYDYAMVSIPYSTSQLNDNKPVTASIPKFYLDNASGVLDWNNPVWSSTSNGTNATLLAGNYSHFSGDIPAWQTLMNNNTCITNQSNFNATNPCYIDTSNHRIWLRIPRFSGIDPSIIGSAVSASSSTTTSSSSGAVVVSPSSTNTQQVYLWDKITAENGTIMKNFNSNIGIKQIQIKVNADAKNVKVTITGYDNRPSGVSVNKTGKVYQYIHIDTQNLLSELSYADVTFRVNKTWISENNLNKSDIAVFRFNTAINNWTELNTSYDGGDSNYDYYKVGLSSFSYFAIAEKPVSESPVLSENDTTTTSNKGASSSIWSRGVLWFWGVIGVIILLGLIVWFVILRVRKKG